ncbi:MAG: geranylgeranyl reductase family protein [Bacteroidales bacterium]|nr:geranylgeranyl reductase family protein [Bacteroidales bacterium]
MNSFDIAILGAGPAGCAAALSLAQTQCRAALFEKEQFPRPKICGDGVCDRSVNVLRAISPQYYNEFLHLAEKQAMHSTLLFYKNNRFELKLKHAGYTCKREMFDNFLFSLVLRNARNVEIFQNCAIQRVEEINGGFVLHNAHGEQFKTRLLIVANGAKSAIAQQLSGKKFSQTNSGVAIRAYYEGVSGCTPQSIELHYKKEFFPGYLWIFPMAHGECNVGFGTSIDIVKNDSVPMQERLQQWISSDPNLAQRFANARRISPLQGGLVPYNHNSFHCSGEGFMLCGDAASLIDPISGGGIGNAMLSGRLAALQAIDCVKNNDFSAAKTKHYEQRLKKRLHREMKTRLRIQQSILRFPFLLSAVAVLAKSKAIFNRITRWYN